MDNEVDLFVSSKCFYSLPFAWLSLSQNFDLWLVRPTRERAPLSLEFMQAAAACLPFTRLHQSPSDSVWGCSLTSLWLCLDHGSLGHQNQVNFSLRFQDKDNIYERFTGTHRGKREKGYVAVW